ncbi:MAG: hypothetical protein KDA84_25890, partial [Planctomycetaceae bacterium]|nr:hypothetical protein [Planctomycetaceae bacterium]
IGFSGSMFDQPDWMDRAQQLITSKVHPMQRLAGEMVRLSRFDLELPNIGESTNRCRVDPQHATQVYFHNQATKIKHSLSRWAKRQATRLRTCFDSHTARESLSRDLGGE